MKLQIVKTNQGYVAISDEKPYQKDTKTKDEEFIYPGYMSTEAQEFFKGHYTEEQRDGCGAVGTFLKLSDGKTRMPSKGDVFIRDKKGISLKQSV